MHNTDILCRPGRKSRLCRNVNERAPVAHCYRRLIARGSRDIVIILKKNSAREQLRVAGGGENTINRSRPAENSRGARRYCYYTPGRRRGIGSRNRTRYHGIRARGMCGRADGGLRREVVRGTGVGVGINSSGPSGKTTGWETARLVR